MAINTQSILSTLETKIASMDSNTPLDDMIVNIKSYQEVGGVVSIQYDSSGAMPILESAQAGLVLYSASDTALYTFNGNAWAAVGNIAAAGDAGGGAGGGPVSWTVDLSNASYDNVSFSVSSQDSGPHDIAFNSDGTKMYMVGIGSSTVYQYTLSTGFDLSTASYDSVSFSMSSQDSAVSGIAFNSDGTKMYMVGYTNDSIHQYSLSTGFDVSTASYDSVSFSVSSQELVPTGLAFNTDGTKMYISGNNSTRIYQYTLSTGFDLSTASYDSVNFNVFSVESSPYSLAFNTDGTKIYLVGRQYDRVQQYSLSTGFDLSTISYDSVDFSVKSQDDDPAGLVFSSDGTKMYMCGVATDTVYQYSTGL